MKAPEHPLEFPNRAAWRSWLEEHHAQEQEAWLLLHKSGAARQGLGISEAVEEALCFGWIDGLLKPVDAEKYTLRFTPRRPGSVWSETNKHRVEKMIAAGRMTDAGLEKVAQAKASGEWEAARVREVLMAVPPDLEQALGFESEALATFLAWAPSRKKMLLGWLASAKRAETRAKRIGKIVELACLGENADFNRMVY